MNTTWLEVHQKFIGASRSFREAVALYRQGQDNAPQGYCAPTACLRAMLAGQTFMESGRRQILIASGEELPSDRAAIRYCCKARPGQQSSAHRFLRLTPWGGR